MATELTEYLKGQSALGVYDSSDVFTLDTLRMGRKMAAHQFPERALWLVKMVQAAVVMEASDLQVCFQKRKVIVSFSVPNGGPTAERLLHGIFRPEPSPPRHIKHLVEALRACVAQDTQVVRWEAQGPEGGDWVELTAETTEVGYLKPSDRPNYEYRFEVGCPAIRPTFKKALRQRCVDLVREVGEEYVATVSRCWSAPISIQLDGIDLETGIPHPGMRHLSDCRLVGCGVDRYHMGDHWLALRPLSVDGVSKGFPESYWRNLTAGSKIQLCSPVKPKECFLRWPLVVGSNALLLLSFSSLAQLGIDFLFDGVLIDQFDFPYPRPLQAADRLLPAYQRQAVGFRLFVVVEPEQVDISGFQVREKEQLSQHLYRQLRAPLLTTIIELQALLPSYRFAPAKQEKKSRWLDRMLAPIARLNRGFTNREAARTLEQLREHVEATHGYD